MFRPQKLPPIPYLLSNMIQPRKPRKFPEDEREIRTDKELARLPMEERKDEVRPTGSSVCLLRRSLTCPAVLSRSVLQSRTRIWVMQACVVLMAPPIMARTADALW
jgi:hypothetical protein